MDITSLVVDFLGDTPVIYMIGVFSILVLIDLSLAIYIAAKSPIIKFHTFTDFFAPFLQYTLYLLIAQTIVTLSKDVIVLHEVFYGVQILAFISVVYKYYKSIEGKLKAMGATIDEGIDDLIGNRLSGILKKTPTEDEGKRDQTKASTADEVTPDTVMDSYKERESEE